MGILGGLGVCNSHFFVMSSMFLFSYSSCISCCISTINFKLLV